jgi:hypothetical protein
MNCPDAGGRGRKPPFNHLRIRPTASDVDVRADSADVFGRRLVRRWGLIEEYQQVPACRPAARD